MFKSKPILSFCSLLLFFLLCLNFGSVKVSAASDNNLIDSNLSNWENGNEYNITVTPSGGVYRLTLADASPITYFGFLLTDTTLIAGHSYSLTFKLPSRTECNEAFGNSYSASVYNNHFENSVVSIGVGFIDASGNMNTPNDFILYTIDKTNYTNYFGKTLRASFVASSYSGTPCIYICLCSTDSEKHTFYFSNFSLYDNDDNSKELTGILGAVHNIRWSFIGGPCDDNSDCPHYENEANPHKGLATLISESLSDKFAEISNHFKDGSKLHDWFSNLSDKLKDLDTTFSVDIGNLGDSVDTWFSDMADNWNEWIDSLKLKFQEIGDNFLAFFDKFKPRVSVDLSWQRGSVNTSGELSNSPVRVVTSDLFAVNSNTVYACSYYPVGTSAQSVYAIHQYDYKGNYIGIFQEGKTGFEDLVLPSDYCYRFVIYWASGWDLDSSLINESFVVYAEEGWLNAVLFNLKVGIKSLFVPSDDFLEPYQEFMDDLLTVHLGVVYQSAETFVELFSNVYDLLDGSEPGSDFKFPSLKFKLNFGRGENTNSYDINLYDGSESVDFSFLNEEGSFWYTFYHVYYKAILNIIFSGALLLYAYNVFDKIFR